MGSWRKVGAFLGLVPDDTHPYDGEHDEHDDPRGRDYDRHDDYADAGYRGADQRGTDYRSADYREPEPASGPDADRPDYTPAYRSRPRRSFAEEPVTQGALAVQTRPDTRREPDSNQAVRPVTVKLTGFAEARIVGEKFREGQSVILDMTEMDDADARRLVDFAAGLAFALRGSIDKVTNKVFMLLPAAGLGVDFDEETRDAALADARRFATASR